MPHVPHHLHFAHDTPDEVWLSEVKHNGWLILTRDQRIRYRKNELRALVDAKLMMFVLSQGGLTAEETGRIFARQPLGVTPGLISTPLVYDIRNTTNPP